MSGLAGKRTIARDLVDRYTSPSGHFAFATYDHWYGYDGPLTPADVLLANLLSLRLTWREVIPLFAAGHGDAQALRAALDNALVSLAPARALSDHSSVQDLEDTVRSLVAANEAAEAVPGWTYVTVSKVLHRRRPHIVPLIDSRVRAFYGARRPANIRRALYDDLQDNRSWMADLADGRKTPDGRPLTLLRLADILIWTA